MKLNKRTPRDQIPFPVLFDTAIYSSSEMRTFFTRYRKEIKRAEKKGYFNYETNKFEIPEKDFKIIKNGRRFKDDLDIVESVGYTLI